MKKNIHRVQPHDGSLLSDEEAMVRVAEAGDGQAFSLLVGRWRGVIERTCGRMLGDVARGEDVAQDVFLRLYQKRGDYRAGRSRFSTYLWRMALNRCYDELRARRRRSEEEWDEEAFRYLRGGEGHPGTEVMRLEEGALVRRAVALLPEHYRVVLVLRHFEGMKFREIAEVLEIPEGTVCSRMAQALSLLSSELAGLMELRGLGKEEGR